MKSAAIPPLEALVDPCFCPEVAVFTGHTPMPVTCTRHLHSPLARRRSLDLPGAIEIGSATIHRIVEQEGPFFDAMQFFPTATKEFLDENRRWLQPRFLDANDKLILCIQSYVVRTPHHTIMIDTCVGNHKPRPTRSFWNMMNSDRYEKSLAASGFGVNDIDFVMCTHLHTDHVGWNTRLENGRWVPTFPKARYVFADRELAYWTKRQQDDPAACPWIVDSVLPIVAANRADIVAFYDDVFGWKEIPQLTQDRERLVLMAYRYDQFVFLIADEPHMTAPRLDHFGMGVDTMDELDEFLRRATTFKARDDRVDIIDKKAEDHGVLVITSFYVRYLLPLMVEVQHYEMKDGEASQR